MLVRGTPLLVQLYLLYYGFGQIVPREWMRDSWASPLLRDAFWYAVVALSVNEGAYVATILRGAIAGVPAGEIEAGFAYGMTRAGVLRRIVGPRAWRLALPALTGEAILLLKSTVLASTVTVFDVMGTANTLRFETLRVYEPLAGAAIVYVVLVALLTIPAARLEKHLNRYLTREARRSPARTAPPRIVRRVGGTQLIPAFALNTTMSDPRPLLFSFTNRPASAAAVRRACGPIPPTNGCARIRSRSGRTSRARPSRPISTCCSSRTCSACTTSMAGRPTRRSGGRSRRPRTIR